MAGRRIGGAGGGSSPGTVKAGGLLVAASLAVVLGVGGTTTLSGSAASGSSGPSSSSRTASRLSDRDSEAAVARLTARGARATIRFTEDATDCAARSHGQVQAFFEQHPCTALHRSLIELTDRKGDVALVAVAWVEMPTEAEAADLKRLLDNGGTGNITELSRERGRYRTVRYTGDAYASRQDGTNVVNAQATPVLRGWAGLALTSAVTNAVG